MKTKISKILGVGLTLALLASLLLTAAPISADVSEPEVDVDNTEISADSAYTIIFNVNDELDNAADSIEIRFPEGTILDDAALADADITVQTESTFGNDNAATPVGDDTTFTEDPDDVWTVTIDLVSLGLDVSDNSAVKVEFVDATLITNPDDPGMYTLEVRTSIEDDWVESEEYEIEVPDVGVLPGVVAVYNAANIKMANYTGADAIQDGLDLAGDGWTIWIGEGEYTEDPNTVSDGVTVKGSGDIEDIVIVGMWTIGHAEITLDNLTLDGDEGATAILLDVGSTDFTVQDCVLQYAGTALIDDDGSAVDTPTTIDSCTLNIEDEIGVDIGNANAGVEIVDCTFNVDDGGDGVCVEINADATVSDNTFNGGSGVGVQVIAGDSEISGNTFDGLEIAFDINGGTADINTNTITGCE